MALIACLECKREISEQASSCPHCGVRRNWVHPAIDKFMKADLDIPPFRFHANGAILKGWTEPVQWDMKLLLTASLCFCWLALRWMLDFSGLIGHLFGGNFLVMLKVERFLEISDQVLLYAGGAGLLIGGILSVTGLGSFGAQTFQADFTVDPPKWTSTDDEYWAEVRSVLGIR